MSDEEITTLHISNLPTDMKERELFLLYGTMPGFMSGQLKHTPGKTMGFVVFETREQAAEALKRTTMLSWKGNPPEFTLRVVFAQKQTRNARNDKTVVANVQPHMEFAVAQLPPHVRGAALWTPQPKDMPYQPVPYGASLPQAVPQPHQMQQQRATSTLHVGNIKTDATDDDLRASFQPQPSKIVRQGTKAWVSFERQEDARNAMNYYNDSSVNVPKENRLRVSFARSDTRSRPGSSTEAA